MKSIKHLNSGRQVPFKKMSSAASTGSRSSKKQKGKKWEPLALPSEDVLSSATSQDALSAIPLPTGYTIRFFPHDMRLMYTAPSKHIRLTQGVIDYVREHNQQGPSKTKAKLFLCTMFERHGSCENGFMCREVHCDLKVSNAKVRSLVPPSVIAASRPAAVLDEETNPLHDVSSHVGLDVVSELESSMTSDADFSSSAASSTTSTVGKLTLALVDPDDDEVVCTAVHMRNAPEDAHPRLPPGVVYRLALPNMQSPSDDIPSEKVFVTKGAKDYYDQMISGETPTMNMQHCAHFSKNGMCCFGSDCQFVHVAQYRKICGINDTDSSGAESTGGRANAQGSGARRRSNSEHSSHGSGKGSDRGLSRTSSGSSLSKNKNGGAKKSGSNLTAQSLANHVSVVEGMMLQNNLNNGLSIASPVALPFKHHEPFQSVVVGLPPQQQQQQQQQTQYAAYQQQLLQHQQQQQFAATNVISVGGQQFFSPHQLTAAPQQQYYAAGGGGQAFIGVPPTAQQQQLPAQLQPQHPPQYGGNNGQQQQLQFVYQQQPQAHQPQQPQTFYFATPGTTAATGGRSTPPQQQQQLYHQQISVGAAPNSTQQQLPSQQQQQWQHQPQQAVAGQQQQGAQAQQQVYYVISPQQQQQQYVQQSAAAAAQQQGSQAAQHQQQQRYFVVSPQQQQQQQMIMGGNVGFSAQQQQYYQQQQQFGSQQSYTVPGASAAGAGSGGAAAHQPMYFAQQSASPQAAGQQVQQPQQQPQPQSAAASASLPFSSGGSIGTFLPPGASNPW